MQHVRRFEEYLLESSIPFNAQNGKVVAYHGTPFGEFDKFSLTKRGKGADQGGFGDFGNGLYFTPSKEEAVGYAHGLTKHGIGNQPYLYTVELTMNKPFRLDMHRAYHDAIRVRTKEVGGFFKMTDADYAEINDRFNLTEEEVEFISEVEMIMSDNWAEHNIARMLKKQGYDSVISYAGNEYMVFGTRQVKILSREAV